MKKPYYQYYILTEGMEYYARSGNLERFYEVDSFFNDLFVLYATKKISKIETLSDRCRASLRHYIEGFAGFPKEVWQKDAEDNIQKLRSEIKKKGYSTLI